MTWLFMLGTACHVVVPYNPICTPYVSTTTTKNPKKSKKIQNFPKDQNFPKNPKKKSKKNS
jgi:hypothetical protein